MKTFFILPLLAASPLLFLCGGCSTTIADRIGAYQGIFNSLTPDEQANIKQGRVAVGYTQNMVYMALGKPSLVGTNHATNEIAWLYTQSPPHSYSPVPQAAPAVPFVDTTPAYAHPAFVEFPSPASAPMLAPPDTIGAPRAQFDSPSNTYTYGKVICRIVFRDGKVVEIGQKP